MRKRVCIHPPLSGCTQQRGKWRNLITTRGSKLLERACFNMILLQGLLFFFLVSAPLSFCAIHHHVGKNDDHRSGDKGMHPQSKERDENGQPIPPVIHYHKYKGADDITTVPYLDGEVLQSFLKDYGMLYDMKRTQECLSGKKIAVFGDSTIEDFVYDLALLLSGISRNKKIMNDFIERSTQPALDPYVKIKIPTSPMYMEFHKGRRNITIIDPENNIYIRHRFTGHVSLKANRLGIKTFFRKEFQDELDCILGFVEDYRKKECRKPDFIIMNSGLHDDKKRPDYFQDKLRALLENWKKKYKHMARGNVEIFWRGLLEGSGSLDHPYPSGLLEEFNGYAKEVVKDFNIPFVNISDVFNYVPGYKTNRFHYTKDNIHFGSLARDPSTGSMEVTGTISMLITQRMLQAMCRGDEHKFIGKNDWAPSGRED